MSQCVRYCFDGDANADSFCCERMASIAEMPFQPYASADALVLYSLENSMVSEYARSGGLLFEPIYSLIE